MVVDSRQEIWIGAGAVARRLGVGRASVYQYDAELAPQITDLPSGRKRRTYAQSRVDAFARRRAELLAQAENLKADFIASKRSR